MLRLVVVPCLNAHKRHVRDPPPFPITLLEGLFDRHVRVETGMAPRLRRLPPEDSWVVALTEETTASQEKVNGVGVTSPLSTGLSIPSTFSDERRTRSGEMIRISAANVSFSAWHASCLMKTFEEEHALEEERECGSRGLSPC